MPGHLARVLALVIVPVLITGLAWPTAAAAQSTREWRARVAAVKGCRPLPRETYAASIHAEVLFDRKAGVGMVAPVKSQTRDTYQCGAQKIGVFLYEFDGVEGARSAFAYVRPLLWGGPGPTDEHPDRAYMKGSTVIVLSSRARNVIDELFAEKEADESAGLGRYLAQSTAGNQLLHRQKRYDEALAAYRRYKQQVDADPAAPDLARWDAAVGVGLAAAYSGKMEESRAAFLSAVPPAGRLDPGKLADTYYNLACSEAELGQREAALGSLRKCMAAARRAGPEEVANYQRNMRTDDSLKSLRGDPQLQAIISGK